MSNNTAIRLTEQPDGTWEVCQYDVDRGPPPYPYSMSAPYIAEVGCDLDGALDIAHKRTSEYGLEIVRLKDMQTPKHLHECDCGWTEQNSPNWEEVLSDVPSSS